MRFWTRTSYQDQARKVTKLMSRKVDHYYQLDTGFDTLLVTGEHPFWLQGAGWTNASDLVTGNAIATENGDILLRKVTRVEEQAQVYNFSVEDTPSYFVGSNGLWVHNANANCDISERIARTKAKPSDPLEAPKARKTIDPELSPALAKIYSSMDSGRRRFLESGVLKKPVQTKAPNEFVSSDENAIIRGKSVKYLDGAMKPFTFSVKTKSGKRIRYDEEGFPDLSDHLYEGPEIKYNTVTIKLSGVDR
ncbi:polymorphic toxin-type HINT domain-containing protein [Endozoicomonas sp. ALE010]|uniref:polymorphic toxin-type HINT domain-containing protein n=1 Tax=Endozoicomonas sp. ALE010 TaxID=3403081 RepID=UPI003BB6A31C